MSSDRSERASPADDVAAPSFVGGFSVAYQDSPFAKYRFTWPLARLTLSTQELRLSARLPLGLLMKPIMIPYADITSVEARMGRMIGTLVFHSRRRELDGISFGSLKISGLDRLLELLESRGLLVDRRTAKS
jgi:hypothetical protein